MQCGTFLESAQNVGVHWVDLKYPPAFSTTPIAKSVTLNTMRGIYTDFNGASKALTSNVPSVIYDAFNPRMPREMDSSRTLKSSFPASH